MTERTCQQRSSVLQHLNVLVSGMLCTSIVGKVRMIRPHLHGHQISPSMVPYIWWLNAVCTRYPPVYIG